MRRRGLRHRAALPGRDPNSTNAANYRAANDLLLKLRPNIRYFHSQYINDLANGDICVAIGWSGE